MCVNVGVGVSVECRSQVECWECGCVKSVTECVCECGGCVLSRSQVECWECGVLRVCDSVCVSV